MINYHTYYLDENKKSIKKWNFDKKVYVKINQTKKLFILKYKIII